MTSGAYEWLHKPQESGFDAGQKPDGVFVGNHLVQYLGEVVEMAVYARPLSRNYQVNEVNELNDRDSISIMRPARATSQHNPRPIDDQFAENQRVGVIDSTKTHLRAAKRLSGWALLLACVDTATMGISQQHAPVLIGESIIHPVQTFENVMAIPKGVVELGKTVVDGVDKLSSVGGLLG